MGWNYSSMLWLKLIHVSKRDHRQQAITWTNVDQAHWHTVWWQHISPDSSMMSTIFKAHTCWSGVVVRDNHLISAIQSLLASYICWLMDGRHICKWYVMGTSPWIKSLDKVCTSVMKYICLIQLHFRRTGNHFPKLTVLGSPSESSTKC